LAPGSLARVGNLDFAGLLQVSGSFGFSITLDRSGKSTSKRTARRPSLGSTGDNEALTIVR
jgi:hypothetical protein